MRLLARQQAKVSFTCVEMRDCEHPPEGRCSPQGMLPEANTGYLRPCQPNSGYIEALIVIHKALLNVSSCKVNGAKMSEIHLITLLKSNNTISVLM